MSGQDKPRKDARACRRLARERRTGLQSSMARESDDEGGFGATSNRRTRPRSSVADPTSDELDLFGQPVRRPTKKRSADPTLEEPVGCSRPRNARQEPWLRVDEAHFEGQNDDEFIQLNVDEVKNQS